MHTLASKLAEETDLTHNQHVYNANDKKVKAPTHDAPDLTPPIRKRTYAPDVDPSTLISDEGVFRALMGIDRSTANF